MQQLYYRVAELERLQLDPTSSSSTQHTTTELQLHQEIQQLAHQLQHTQLHIPTVIHQQVQATTAPHTAQLKHCVSRSFFKPRIYHRTTPFTLTSRTGLLPALFSPLWLF